MSKDQEKQAVRLANVPAEEFEAAIESESPPTITALAQLGIVPHPRPQNFYAATHTIAAMQTFASFCAKYPAERVADGLSPEEAQEVVELINKLDAWLDILITHLPTQAAHV
jgi:hypothetical protein